MPAPVETGQFLASEGEEFSVRIGRMGGDSSIEIRPDDTLILTSLATGRVQTVSGLDALSCLEFSGDGVTSPLVATSTIDNEPSGNTFGVIRPFKGELFSIQVYRQSSDQGDEILNDDRVAVTSDHDGKVLIISGTDFRSQFALHSGESLSADALYVYILD